MATKKAPTLLITYFCSRCKHDFMRMEGKKAVCSRCKKNDRLLEIKREIATPEVIEAGFIRSIDRMKERLHTMYEKVGKMGGLAEKEEIEILEMLIKAENLRKHVKKVFHGTRKKKGEVHVASITIQ